MTPTLQRILAALNRNHRKAAMPEPEPANDSDHCPNCRHSQHLPGTECEAVVDHGPSHWHRCLCLNWANTDRPCPLGMTCQGGTLGYSDIWHLQRGHSLWSADGVVSPEVLRLDPTRSPTAAQPAPADRAGILREAADRIGSYRGALNGKEWPEFAADELRRMADEAQQPEASRCPRCGDSLADYTDDDLVYRVGDERPYCSGECVIAEHRAALKQQPTPCSDHDANEPGPADA